MSGGGGSLAEERPATLEAATETETPYGGRIEVWAPVATLWVALRPGPVRDGAATEDHPPAAAQAATAIARDHPFAGAGQRLVLTGEPPFRVRELRRGEPAPGRMTLVLDRLL